MTTILVILTLLCAAPLGLIMSLITKDEKEIYTKYFYSLEWFLLFVTAIFLTTNKTYALTTGFLIILIFFWNNSEKVLNSIKDRFKKAKKLIRI